MLNIIVVFLASVIVIGSLAYLALTYDNRSESEKEEFGIPTRTQTFVEENQKCETEDEEEIISMEDVLKMRNHNGETVAQKVTQKASGMGYRDGDVAGPTDSSSQVSKPENQLKSKNGIVWADNTEQSADAIGPSHLMGSIEAPTSGGILPGLDREQGSYSTV